MTDQLADRINEAVDQLLMSSDVRDYRGPIARKVGPILSGPDGRPVQMEMTLDQGIVDAVYDPERYRVTGIGAVPGQRGTIDALENSTPQKVREIAFGWTTPELAGTGRGGMSYDNTVDTRGVDFKRKLQEVKESLLEQAGMQAGDLISAVPYGLAEGDLKRAMTYVRQGYGLPDASSHVMYGQLQSDGSLQPVQLFTPEASMMKRLGFKQA